MTPPAWVCVFLPGVMEYIQQMRDVLCDLQTRVQKTKLNVDSITQLMEVPSAGALWVPSREGSCGDLPIPSTAEQLPRLLPAGMRSCSPV